MDIEAGRGMARTGVLRIGPARFGEVRISR
jgi:hypothetical protein